MSKKTTTIIYWIATGIFCLLFATTGTLYLAHSAFFVARLVPLGYPLYVLNILGTAKLVGVVLLLVPQVPARMKEWAYAGFAFDFGGAIWSHLAVQDVVEAFRLTLPIALGTISYFTYRRLQTDAE